MDRRNFLKLFIASFLAWLIRLFDRTKAQEPEDKYKIFLPIIAMTNSENWEIVKPKEITNLITNPSFEEGTTGYSNSGTSIARTSACQMFGVYSLAISSASAEDDGVSWLWSNIPSDSASYVFSLWIRGEEGASYKMQLSPNAGPTVASTFTATGYWQSASLQGGVGAGATTANLWLRLNASTADHTFYTDAWQLEQSTACARTTYCDGDQPGCYWLGEPHQSKSRRDGQSREGGEIINLSTDYQVIVRQQQGAGMPDIDLIETDTGLQDGGLFQRALAGQRQLQIDGVISGSDVTDFHYNRKRLIDAVKTDLVSPEQPFLLRYTGIDGVIMQGRFFYDAGLELGQVRNLTEMFSIRAIAFDPYWEEYGDQGVELTPAREIADDYIIYHRETSGCWIGIGASPGGGISQGNFGLYWKNPGQLYFGGVFTTIGGVSTCNVGLYDISSSTNEIVELDNGLEGAWTNDSVLAIAEAPNGNIFFGGLFDTAGSAGTSVCNIVEWDGNQWHQIKEPGSTNFGIPASGTKTPVLDMKFDNDGLLWVFGLFGTAGCITASNIAIWNTSTCRWSIPNGNGPGTASGGPHVQDATILNDKVWFAGDFHSLGGSTVCYVGYYDTSLSKFSASQDVGLGSLITGCGLNDGFGIEHTPDGTIYSILNVTSDGDFLVQSNGGEFGFTACPMAGLGFMELGRRSGNIYLVPSASFRPFSATISGISFYNGTTFLPLDFALETFDDTATFGAADEPPIDGITIGLSEPSTASVGGFDQVSNDGTATTFPIITISGSGNLYTLSNYTRKDIIYFNELPLNQGDTITIDLQGKEVISKQLGNLTNKVLPSSNLADWKLGPGVNNISLFITNTTASATMRWKKRHWSLDGGAD